MNTGGSPRLWCKHTTHAPVPPSVLAFAPCTPSHAPAPQFGTPLPSLLADPPCQPSLAPPPCPSAHPSPWLAGARRAEEAGRRPCPVAPLRAHVTVSIEVQAPGATGAESASQWRRQQGTCIRRIAMHRAAAASSPSPHRSPIMQRLPEHQAVLPQLRSRRLSRIHAAGCGSRWLEVRAEPGRWGCACSWSRPAACCRTHAVG